VCTSHASYDQVSTLERRQLDGGELLVRLKLVEDRLTEAATATGGSSSGGSSGVAVCGG
jgi:hypothetical protein